MSLYLPHLDARTRRLMLQELAYDERRLMLHISPYLSGRGVHDYPQLLRRAIVEHDPTWLALQLNERRRLERTHVRRKPKGGYAIASVPHNAAVVIADGEFNRFYIRAICRRAIEDGLDRVIVYRARPTQRPRRSSSAIEETALDPSRLLADLRRHTGDERPRLGVPAGPNSSLSVRLPQMTRTVVPAGRPIAAPLPLAATPQLSA